MLSTAAQLGGASLQLVRALAPYAASALQGALAHRRFGGLQAQPAFSEACPLPLPLFHPVFHQRLPVEAGLQGHLSLKERAMVRLYIAGCYHQWNRLPELARDYVAAGCSAEELRGCVRHLVVFSGYAPCLAATLALHKAGVLLEDTPAKCGGPPGNAFELVYGGMTDKVRQKIHAADPALGEWIRCQLYGEVYSSPGLDLRQKQLLACAFLCNANMPDQLLGHLIAGLRFGSSRDELEEAMLLGIQASPLMEEDARGVARSMLSKAYATYQKRFASQHASPDIAVDPSCIQIPAPPPELGSYASSALQ